MHMSVLVLYRKSGPKVQLNFSSSGKTRCNKQQEPPAAFLQLDILIHGERGKGAGGVGDGGNTHRRNDQKCLPLARFKH